MWCMKTKSLEVNHFFDKSSCIVFYRSEVNLHREEPESKREGLFNLEGEIEKKWINWRRVESVN